MMPPPSTSINPVRCYIGLGSNIGNRMHYLMRAHNVLGQHHAIDSVVISSFYETPALLPKNAPPEWDIPFINQVIALDTTLSASDLLQVLKACENTLGRKDRGHWSPREIDCDLLLYGQEIIENDALSVPHPRMAQRGFVLAPLCEIAPEVIIPTRQKTMRELWLECSDKAVTRLSPIRPAIMGVLNITPDSFSDGGKYDNVKMALSQLEEMLAGGADIIDIGAESTRPNAVKLTDAQEWARLEPVLREIMQIHPNRAWHLSVDTYHPRNAERLCAMGVDIINDVSGLNSPEMMMILAKSTCDIVAMHSLTIPADKNIVWVEDIDPVAAIIAWAEQTIARAQNAGIARNRLILDVGIGFGKTASQSLALITRADELRAALPDIRWLYGHSRKSFMTLFDDCAATQRDGMTLQFSQMLSYHGADMLRVHSVAAHRSLLDMLCQ